MQLGERTTCTHQGLNVNVTWTKELLSMQGLFISILYPIKLKNIMINKVFNFKVIFLISWDTLIILT